MTLHTLQLLFPDFACPFSDHLSQGFPSTTLSSVAYAATSAFDDALVHGFVVQAKTRQRQRGPCSCKSGKGCSGLITAFSQIGLLLSIPECGSGEPSCTVHLTADSLGFGEFEPTVLR